MIEKTCCFTGHRRLPQDKMDTILLRLNNEIEKCIAQGVCDFISGGALGFDLISASLIIAKKEMGASIRLIFALPCRDHTAKWTKEEAHLFDQLLTEADEVRYVSESYQVGCMKKRNQYMVDHAQYCICALLREKSGTAQTVAYAKRKQRNIVNVAK